MTDTATSDARPNVIWIFGDQHRGQALGCAGDPNLNTPNIDTLATEGVRFPQAVGGFPLCCPYRGALLSGRYPQHNGVVGHEYQLNPELPTIAHPFKDAGYRTSYFGKWHIDGHHEREGRGAHHIIGPERRGGFDDWVGYENNNAQYDCWVHGHQDGQEVSLQRLDGYETDVLTDMLIDSIDARAEDGQPFFGVLSVQPPHDPFVAPPQFVADHTPGRIELRPNVPNIPRVVEEARRGLAGYYAQIENIDWNIGRVVAALMATGLFWNTHIVFFSDHGEMLGSHGQFRKMNPYEESIRVPCIIAGGSRYGRHAGRVSDAPVNHVDMGPTSLGLCGIDVPDWMEGTDWSHHRVRKEVDASREPDSAYLQSIVPTMHGNSTDRPWRGVVTRDGWKYVCLEHQPWLLFNLNEDPYEQANLAFNTAFKNKRAELHARLVKWIEDTGDDFALPQV